ncbi:MAG: bifunctional folylpolyglutamate synthase/dihydrofolate synthase [Candidatus Dadabacteria bacterium]|nr:bifunctional folylpolyglutamate synthase/dihydrofolate synthase [Candidatus Dadabacteria bacterium]MYC40102.1 bifunctional folylpolyglutamate synthase/dihydrofolate synthase [Candidatus Dadabacteria bacterium]
MFENLNKLRLKGVDSVKPGLKRITSVLEELGSPHRKKDYVTVAGTNGKGSVAACIAAILEATGYRVGLFTSPHLINVTERIEVNGEEVSKEELEKTLGTVFTACAKLQVQLSYFELLTVAAFLYFNRKSIDIGVLEVGMGGRWDSTNVCDHLASVITNVSFDHTEYLGNTLREIATEKAGIIKKNGLVVTGCTGEALSVVEQRSRENSARCHRIGAEFNYSAKEDLSFDYMGSEWNLPGLKTALSGTYQIENAAISVATTELLTMHTRYKTDPEKVRKALAEISLRGRMEYLDREVPVIIDGAHNVAAGENLVKSLEACHPGTRFNFLITMLENKDIGGFTETLSRISGKLIITELAGERRYLGTEKILALTQGRFDSVETVKDPWEAYEKLLGYGEAACVCGSFYLIGYLKETIENEKALNSK